MALAAMQHFRDVPVVPVTHMRGQVFRGGPLWPRFFRQKAARHCRAGAPVDRRPLVAELAATQPLRGSAVWGGTLGLQFGHLIAEHMTRLPQSLRDRPDDLYLFTLSPGCGARDLPDHIWQVLGWYGLDPAQVHLVEAPLCAADLRVAAQGETLGLPPDAEFLDLLDLLPAARGLCPEPADILYVSREGLVAEGRGGHAGEAYLTGALRRAGVRVLDPRTCGVTDQLAAYAGARALVFAEGSALHGRQMLGRIRQDIHVLRRRARRDTGRAQLQPRCDRLAYHEAVGANLHAEMPGGGDRVDLMLAIYDLEVVFDLFAALGHDLQKGWDEAAYQAAVEADIRAWLGRCHTSPEQRAANIARLTYAGFLTAGPGDMLAGSDGDPVCGLAPEIPVGQAGTCPPMSTPTGPRPA